MYASKKGHEEIVRTLLECRAAQNKVRNQMMMMLIIIIILVLVLTIMMMMMMMMMMMNVINTNHYCTFHISYSTCIYDVWCIHHIVEFIIINIIIIIDEWLHSSSSLFLIYHFYDFYFFHVSSLHHYHRVEALLSWWPVSMVTKILYVL